MARGFGLALGLLVATSLNVHAETPETPKLAGTWTWTWKDRLGETHRHVLEVEGIGNKLAARELFDDQTPVRVANLTLDGNSVRFTVVREARKADYSGKVADPDHINGTVTITSDGQAEEFVWKAERKKDLPK